MGDGSLGGGVGSGGASGPAGGSGAAGRQTQLTRVYLTFDDGPVAATAEVLDVLRDQKVSATFFMNANKLNKRSDLQYQLLHRMVAEGHSFGNHGYDHDPTSKKEYKASSIDAVKEDFLENDRVLRSLFAERGQAFPGLPIARLPGDGRTFPEYVAMITNTLNLPHAAWNFEFAPNGIFTHVNFMNWQQISGVSADHVGLPKIDDIILLHDAHWRGRGALLAQVIATLKKSCTILSLDPLPRGHRSIRYPNP
jgi:peptidoglycan/xylan/chitin deacetylase (PgdA/CDA1 family)